jgi:hypothetical protein
MIDIGFIIGIIIICGMLYYLIVIETNIKKEEEVEEEKYIDKTKTEPIYVYFRTIKEKEPEYKKQHKKKKTEEKVYSHSRKQLYFSLNKILRHFYLTDDFNKKEIMQMNYIPDNFDFSSYINNYKSLGGDTMELNEIVPNNIAKVMLELDNNIQEISDTQIERTKITYDKNRITLKTNDNYFLNIKYSKFPKQEYEISAINQNIIESILKLRQVPMKKDPKNKKKIQKIYYVKFPNDHYLCINKDLILYSSKDKNKIFYFEIIQVPLSQIPEEQITC